MAKKILTIFWIDCFYLKNMRPNIYFKNENLLIEIISKYIIDNGLTDLSGGSRSENNHFRIISSIIYIYIINISSKQWSKLKLYVSGINRSKFNSAVNPFFQKQFTKLGINCLFVLKTNYFSVSKKDFSSKVFWKGLFVCKNCSKSIKAVISKKPVSDKSTLIFFDYDGSQCSAPDKQSIYRKRVCDRERKELQYEIHSKGTGNFWNEATYFGEESKLNIGYDNIWKLSSQHRHRFQL